MIKIENLGFSYVENDIYEKFNIGFRKNSTNVILGHNGAGKTTLLKLIGKLLQEKEGCISYEKESIKTNDIGNIFYLPEQNGCYTNLSVKENIEFFKSIGLENGMEVNQAIKLFKLQNKINNKVDTLSQGLKKRVALANCAVYNANILLLDEPTNGIDPETKDIVIDYVNKLKKDKAVILSTHDLYFAAEVADYIYIIDHGRLVLDEYLDNKNFDALKEKYLQYTVEKI